MSFDIISAMISTITVPHPESDDNTDNTDSDRDRTQSNGNSSPSDSDRDRARMLFRYLGGEEWNEYRAILKVFAGTFFTEFTPDDVNSELSKSDSAVGITYSTANTNNPTVNTTDAIDPATNTTDSATYTPLTTNPAGTATPIVDPEVMPDRLESLRRWGNLTVSSSVGNPASLDDYYRKRNRYLITRIGQEVFDLTEHVLTGIDEIGGVQAGRLRDLHRALMQLGDYNADGFNRVKVDDLTDTVRTVFDLHIGFTTELTQFFAELNQWQSRYDLNAEEVQIFAGVLVDYVSEQLNEIERMTRPIARSLERVLPSIESLLPLLRSGLAERLDDAGLAQSVTVRRLPGTDAKDWERLAAWFVAPQPGRVSRLDQLTRQAVAAVRTLTTNLTRLSRGGLGAASKRADFVRLAGFFDQASGTVEVNEIAAAAFGLGSCRHLGTLAEDAEDPAPTITPWQEAPRATVPVSLRTRGDTTQRGNTTPIRNRRRERELMQQRRERTRIAREAVAAELLACTGADGRIDGARLSVESFAMLRDLISRSGIAAVFGTETRTTTLHGIRCRVRRENGAHTVVECPDGRFAMHGLVVTVTAASQADTTNVNTATAVANTNTAEPAGALL